jgi:hypothetical protein
MIQSTMDKEGQHGLLALFKGESGVGKSVGAFSFPTPYVFDFDCKMPDIAYKHFPDKAIAFEVFKNCQQVDERLIDFATECPYETLIVDSYTGLGTLCWETLAESRGETVAKVLARMNSKAGDTAGMDYYKFEAYYLGEFMKKVKYLQKQPGNPKHVLTTAHVIAYEGAPDFATGGRATKFRSILARGKKPAAILPTELDNVYIFGVHKVDDAFGGGSVHYERICITETFGEDTAKCTFPFPTVMEFTNKSLYDEMFPGAAIREQTATSNF